LGAFLEALGIRRSSRVPPGGALFIELLKVNGGELSVRMYLYYDEQKVEYIKFPIAYKGKRNYAKAIVVE
jgi:hypothetical protein